MKLLTSFLFLLCSTFFNAPPTWQNNFELAKQDAAAGHKYILLNFSGSDWCGPCVKMHKEILSSDVFSSYAVDHLVLVNADFPRQKKNQLTKEQQQQNDQLADRYNREGVFPFTLLLDAQGKIIKTWEGFPKEGADEFTQEIKLAIHGGY